MPLIIVERSFELPLTEAELQAVDGRIASCRENYGVRYLRSYWSADRRRMICQYEAADTASVRNLQHEAEAPFDRAWAADIIGEQ